MCLRVFRFAGFRACPAESTLFSGLLSSVLQKKQKIIGTNFIQGRVSFTPSRRCGERWLSQRRGLHSAQEGDRAPPPAECESKAARRRTATCDGCSFHSGTGCRVHGGSRRDIFSCGLVCAMPCHARPREGGSDGNPLLLFSYHNICPPPGPFVSVRRSVVVLGLAAAAEAFR